ncbi:AraC family transcriptional regulator [Pseudomonas sp. o96-267]|uniref:AraC family transcriptional regulator n=1 Tax=Pseudomonas sp. o96-267 TaxID=2479853 RepID=UPI000F77C152|nr:AraC family transcriptional regulator [Pseudomonas sp. o96-267]RRV32173.1 AraC family transcriptional regulator [Pseudomonas sp. o96-267]
MSDFLLPVQYLRQIAEQLRVMGASPDAWLADCGVQSQELDDQHYQPSIELFSQLMEQALVRSNEPAFGLLLGERLIISTHGALGFAALQGGSLRQVILLLERYLAVRTSLLRVRLEHEESCQREQLRFVAAYKLGSIERTVMEAILLAVKNIIDALSPGSLSIERINFPFPTPSYADLAREIFGCAVEYDQPWAAISFNQSALDVPLRMADPVAFHEAELICQRELQKISESTSLGSRIRRLMLERQTGFPSLVVAARLFYMTPRTLHRHLQAEGTSFKQILMEVRHSLALEHISSGKLSVEEIALTLGYSDVANFRRAFKQWEGVSPSEYRGMKPSV